MGWGFFFIYTPLLGGSSRGSLLAGKKGGSSIDDQLATCGERVVRLRVTRFSAGRACRSSHPTLQCLRDTKNFCLKIRFWDRRKFVASCDDLLGGSDPISEHLHFRPLWCLLLRIDMPVWSGRSIWPVKLTKWRWELEYYRELRL